jgi:hypothetical protein
MLRRRRVENARKCLRILNAHQHGSLLRAIATDIPPNGASAVLTAVQAQRLIQPGRHEAAAPNQRATPPSIGSLLILWRNFRFRSASIGAVEATV